MLYEQQLLRSKLDLGAPDPRHHSDQTVPPAEDMAEMPYGEWTHVMLEFRQLSGGEMVAHGDARATVTLVTVRTADNGEEVISGQTIENHLLSGPTAGVVAIGARFTAVIENLTEPNEAATELQIYWTPIKI